MRWYTLNQQYDKRYYEVKDALSKTLNVSLNVFYIQKYCVHFHVSFYVFMFYVQI